MRVLLLDNYDSFAWNLVQALRALGAAVDVRRNDALTVADALAAAPDAFVVSPGPCDPARAGISVPLVRAAAVRGVPLLGVCLGHQAIGEAFGGRIARARRLLHGKTSIVVHDGAPEFAGVPRSFTAMRYHSLAVEEPLPRTLVRGAWSAASADDAGGELMAVRHTSLPIFGWQFHPESFLSPAGPQLLRNFLEIAAARCAAQVTP